MKHSKYFFLTICFCIAISFFESCKKDRHEIVPSFNYEQAAGVWVPYELIDEFGATISGPFLANNLFGSYSESVQLNSNKTFIPGNWGANTFSPHSRETGTFEYLPNNKLIFKGAWEIEWEIAKFDGDDLWLKIYTQAGEAVYKFKRQH